MKRRIPSSPLESEFQRALLVELSTVPRLRVWRQNAGKVVLRDPRTNSIRSFRAGPPPGAADISGIYTDARDAGIRVEIETKAYGEKMSDAQVQWFHFIESFGGIFVLATAEADLSARDSARLWRDRIAELLRKHGDHRAEK